MTKPIRLGVHLWVVASLGFFASAVPFAAPASDLARRDCTPACMGGLLGTTGSIADGNNCGCLSANAFLDFSSTFTYLGYTYCGGCRCILGWYSAWGKSRGFDLHCAKCPPGSTNTPDSTGCDCREAETGMVWDKDLNLCVCNRPESSAKECICPTRGARWSYLTNTCICPRDTYLETSAQRGGCEPCPKHSSAEAGANTCKCNDRTARLDMKTFPPKCVCPREGYSLNEEGNCVPPSCPAPGWTYSDNSRECECLGLQQANGECKTCPENSSYNRNTQTCNCKGVWDEAKWTCTPCPKGTELKNNICEEVQCTDPLAKMSKQTGRCECFESARDPKGQCRKCPENATLNGSSCDCPGRMDRTLWYCWRCPEPLIHIKAKNYCGCLPKDTVNERCPNCPNGERCLILQGNEPEIMGL